MTPPRLERLMDLCVDLLTRCRRKHKDGRQCVRGLFHRNRHHYRPGK